MTAEEARRAFLEEADRRSASHPLIAEALGILRRSLPFLLDAPAAAARAAGGAWWADTERHMEALARTGGGEPGRLERAVKAYVRQSVEYLSLQRQLEQTERYAMSSFEEARRAVYDRPDVMEGRYLDGLYLSQLFWPNHAAFLSLFRSAWLPRLSGRGIVVDIGCGHGLYTAELACARPGSRVAALDVSIFSLRYTRTLLETRGIDPARHLFLRADVGRGLPLAGGTAAAAVMGEVIEHLERPREALREAARILAPGAPCFMTTAVFAAHVDHIHLFRRVGEVRAMVREAGLAIDEERALPVVEGADPEAPDVAVNYAAVLRRA